MPATPSRPHFNAPLRHRPPPTAVHTTEITAQTASVNVQTLSSSVKTAFALRKISICANFAGSSVYLTPQAPRLRLRPNCTASVSDAAGPMLISPKLKDALDPNPHSHTEREPCRRADHQPSTDGARGFDPAIGRGHV